MISKEQVQHIAQLARIKLQGKEVECFQVEFAQILEYFEVLGKLDVLQVQPMTHTSAQENSWREDTGEPFSSELREKMFSQFSSSADNFLKVPRVFSHE
ncbi:MAG: Asp-tRNA(Asn)/Glu-tRNA(Gln) amidotransferase subunit GatC [Patescibacteria group bacterium]